MEFKTEIEKINGYTLNDLKAREEIEKIKVSIANGLEDLNNNIPNTVKDVEKLKNDINSVFINVLNPPVPLEPVVVGEEDSYIKIQREIITLKGDEDWTLYFSDSSSSMTTFRLVVTDTYDKYVWGGINDIPSLNIINAPVYAGKSSRKPSHFTNISTAIEDNKKIIYYTVPTGCAWDLNSFKNMLSMCNLIIEVDFK